MRGAGNDRDLLAFEPLRQHVGDRRIEPRHETRRRAVIGIGEIGAAAGVRGRRDRGDHGVAAIVVERIKQRIERPRLDGAADLDLLANEPCEIDIETGRIAVRADIVERRIIDVGEKADGLDAGQIRPLRTPARIPKARKYHGARRGGGLVRRRGHGRAIRRRNRKSEQNGRAITRTAGAAERGRRLVVASSVPSDKPVVLARPA